MFTAASSEVDFVPTRRPACGGPSAPALLSLATQSVGFSVSRPAGSVSVRQGNVHLTIVEVVALHGHVSHARHGHANGHGPHAWHGHTHGHGVDIGHRLGHVLDQSAVDVALHRDVLDDRVRHRVWYRVRLVVHVRVNWPVKCITISYVVRNSPGAL